MTHTEIKHEFLEKGLNEGDLVEIKLTNGKILTGRLSYGKPGYELNEKGEKINSRIGLTPPPPPPNMMYGNQIIPVYSENIETIDKI